MRVLVDCYDLIRGRGLSTGIFNYAVHLTRALACIAEAHGIEITLICNEQNAEEFSVGASGLHVEVVDQGPRNKIEKVGWDIRRAARALRAFGADTYFSPRGFVPLGIDRYIDDVVITVHDMIPFYYSRHCASALATIENRYVTTRLIQSVKRARLVVTVSECSALAIKSFSGRTEGIEVIHNGVRKLDVAPASSKPHIFAMASALRHKNLDGVVRGYSAYVRLVGESALPLTVCGATLNDCARWTDDHKVLAKVRCLIGVSDEELDQLYASCAAFLFLSRVEGFGFPPLEALQAGASVIASDIPAHREILGTMCEFVDAEDSAAIGLAIAVTVASARRTARTSVDAILAQYSWQNCAQRFLRALKGDLRGVHTPCDARFNSEA